MGFLPKKAKTGGKDWERTNVMKRTKHRFGKTLKLQEAIQQPRKEKNSNQKKKNLHPQNSF